MKCPHCGVENNFYLARKYNGNEFYVVKEIGKDENGDPFVVMNSSANSDEYAGIEEETLRCESCDRIVLHDDEFSCYQKTYE